MKTLKYLQIIILILVSSGAYGQTITAIANFDPYKPYNYIYSRAPLLSWVGSPDIYRQSFQYFDGLGRLIQTVDYMASPNKKDIIQPVEYDDLGREAYKYLPYSDTITTPTGNYRPGWKAEQSVFYSFRYGSTDGTKAFARTIFDNSPLNRVMKQGASGNNWQPTTTTPVRQSNEHLSSYEYSANAANEVYYWTISGTNPNILFTRQTYSVNTLYKTVVKDENSNPVTEYKDKQGKVVMKKDAVEGKTWYIYDDFELLRCVIPPLASALAGAASFNINTSTDFTELCYYYEYDNRQRMIKKKLPGTIGYYEMTYDNLDRLATTKDPNGTIITNTYDVFSRVIQTSSNTKGTLTKTYYESYTVDGTDMSNTDPFKFANVYSENAKTDKIRGFVTFTQTWLLMTTNGFTSLRSINYYDKYGRVIQTISENHKGGMDRVSFKYKYKNSDLVSEKKHEHTISGTTDVQTIIESYSYDHAGRLLTTNHKINSNATTILDSLTYNETGSLRSKNQNRLHDMVYRYNIRGWLTYINNDPGNYVNGKLFNMSLVYNYNGNISDLRWKYEDNIYKQYQFSYDNINRLTQSTYCAVAVSPPPVPPSVIAGETNRYNETYTYDANGNIKTVKRYGSLQDGSGFNGLVDDLNYVYNNSEKSNRLKAVGDNAGDITNRGDFNESNSNGSSTQEYNYDNNGNMTRDKNKNLYTIQYNLLNLPEYIYKSPTEEMSIYYSTTGQKLRARRGLGYGSYNTTDYIGPFVYKNGVLDYIINSEGRAVYTNGTFSYYEFDIKDHLGNVRVAFKRSAANTPEVLQRNNYYPFGLLMAERTDNAANKNKYLYNGKEMQDDFGINWYDYGARMYDPQLGRWHSVDPLAEATFGCTPYMYAGNNPAKLIDPNGMYNTVEEMVQDAWDKTPAGSRGKFNYSNGEMTSYSIITDPLQSALNEFFYRSTIEQYKLNITDGAEEEPGWVGVNQRKLEPVKITNMFATVIVIGGISVKVRIYYIPYNKKATIKDIKDFGKPGGLDPGQSGRLFKIRGSDEKVIAEVWIDMGSENMKAFDLGTKYHLYKGNRDASEKINKKFYEYYKKLLEEHIKKYNIDEKKYDYEE